MIESSIVSSSIWDSELFQTENTLDASSHLDLNCDFDSTRDELMSGYSTPNDTSSSSSDYDGFVLLDDFDNYFPLSDSFVSEILDNSVTGISELDRVSSIDNNPQKDSTVSSFNPGTGIQRNAVDYLLSSKLWSHMSPEEQLNTLHALSEVTYHMGLREQMEIIKIIDPTAIIAPDCKEFALDSTNLDDIKLKKIISFVIKQRHHLKNSSQSLNNFSSLSSKNKSSSSKLLSRKNSPAYARTKRKSQKKQRNILFNGEDKKKNLKRLKQTRKERRSGFFVYEKKMVINTVLEDEDINILE